MRKSVEQIFDGMQAGVLEVGRAARTDALEELQRRRKRIGLSHEPLLDDYRLPALHLDLADAGRQRERIVEADASRLLRRLANSS